MQCITFTNSPALNNYTEICGTVRIRWHTGFFLESLYHMAIKPKLITPFLTLNGLKLFNSYISLWKVSILVYIHFLKLVSVPFFCDFNRKYIDVLNHRDFYFSCEQHTLNYSINRKFLLFLNHVGCDVIDVWEATNVHIDRFFDPFILYLKIIQILGQNNLSSSNSPRTTPPLLNRPASLLLVIPTIPFDNSIFGWSYISSIIHL